MANTKSAQKRAKQTVVRREHNMALRSRMRTAVKKVLKAINSGDRDAAVAEYKAAVPVIDGMVNKGLVHRNKAARQKSRLNARVKTLGQ
ncbi:MAG: 30S ribosomal protein S20 [Gammaproteobacteria bacterium]|nr:30S ribosomal protein S20 [Gammaproteobacteria bacterium]TVQ50284.1 MAG: 30S ribosomal protein S20 [Gammaproteobacteria bacterium]